MGEPKMKKVGIVDVKFGENCTVVEPCNVYGCTIGDGTFIGPFVEIQKGAVIGKRCKIQSHSFVCDLVTIGDDCVVAHGVMFINDLFKTGGPANNNRALWAYTKIGNKVSIGTGSTILAVNICDNVVIGAGSVVTKDITKPGIYAGNPAKFLRSL